MRLGEGGELLLPMVVVVALIVGTWQFASTTAKFDGRLERVEQGVEDIKAGMDRMAADGRAAAAEHLRRADLAAWVQRFQELNPDLRVPEPSGGR